MEMRPEGNTHLYRLDSEPIQTMSKGLLSSEKMPRWLMMSRVMPGAQVLKDFFEGSQLREITSQS
ncbi:hypothetical protein KDK_52380 [Dictyobacter kobayashii]|uniref:Uncharacterized protein n=1 Tax=Dictyobacter kobayashii TaxID=2014872 RepID=A0A402AQR7_9CHLR|nr:hypothetical protein KDK_52380 [Dictyobacter kobayashii]